MNLIEANKEDITVESIPLGKRIDQIISLLHDNVPQLVHIPITLDVWCICNRITEEIGIFKQNDLLISCGSILLMCRRKVVKHSWNMNPILGPDPHIILT